MTEGDRTRRRDAAATRQALLAAAAELFTARGFDRTSVRDIAALAEVNQALVFRYFGSKEELLGAVLTAPGREIVATTPPEELLTRLVGEIFAGEPGGPGANLLLMALSGPQDGGAAEALDREVAAPLRAALRSLTDDPSADLRAELVCAWLLGIALVRQIRLDGPVAKTDPAEVTPVVLDAVTRLLTDG
ncbi:Transcriptional regulator, TetR family [Actinokineospora spheciospongiae]|uniref:Transcriptional regulator, TetR family n=1 Tax=Actinokineospora spheciospongiae TaxID=909613 RepID=W7J4K0_9PSEU|nr:TetR family transcriptional regulator [Actinokineospora spheciospongiae]EWC63906.1 Transcriptional regulator, TetR family [Actinokineospora spheciospongiae]PWW51917.1 TetR family transcriptional regulator [Actinokineospora spheciospongiae]